MGITADIVIIVVAALCGALIAQKLRQPLIQHLVDAAANHSLRLRQVLAAASTSTVRAGQKAGTIIIIDLLKGNGYISAP